jgi:hypothetical protein
MAAIRIAAGILLAQGTTIIHPDRALVPGLAPMVDLGLMAAAATIIITVASRRS